MFLWLFQRMTKIRDKISDIIISKLYYIIKCFAEFAV